MSFQAYLDNVKAKTGKSPAEFARLATQKGLSKHGEIVAWLKSTFELGHGHATAVAGVILKGGNPPRSDAKKLEDLFSGTKASWRKPCDALITKIAKFGPDVEAVANSTYVNLLRAKKKFGILQPASASRLDIGIKLNRAVSETLEIGDSLIATTRLCTEPASGLALSPPCVKEYTQYCSSSWLCNLANTAPPARALEPRCHLH